MPELNFTDLNFLAIVVAALAAFFLGGLWYGGVFAKPWVKAHGYSDEEAKELGKNPAKNFSIMFVAELIGAFFMAVLFKTFGVAGGGAGAFTGALLWVGVALPLVLADNTAHSRKGACLLIDGSYHLAYIVAMGAILGGWQ